MDSTFVKGRQGEELACRFLQEKNYTVLARNFVYKGNEVDIIAKDKNEIVFVEVKERATDVFGEPFRAVNHKKQLSIINVANYYMQKFNIDLEARFDIVSIVLKENSSADILHIENAFSPIELLSKKRF